MKKRLHMNYKEQLADKSLQRSGIFDNTVNRKKKSRIDSVAYANTRVDLHRPESYP